MGRSGGTEVESCLDLWCSEVSDRGVESYGDCLQELGWCAVFVAGDGALLPMLFGLRKTMP